MKKPITKPTAEELKQVAEWMEPDFTWVFYPSNGNIVRKSTEEEKRKSRGNGGLEILYVTFTPESNPAQELKLIRMYRGWLQCEVAYFTMDTDKALMRATESSETLIAAILRDVIGGK